MKVSETQVSITTEYIKLEALLKHAGISETGGQAKTMIQGGEVQVNGEVCLQRGKKIRPGDSIMVAGRKYVVR
ncbi:RNA-binding S4 domain-containing protein [Papillibacter cinnamivorans]|uniref:Ribosome-associated protein n=1 Tax=Papillibacter cinnamivorans DSM 12816 TaxID=1122930 RepID=A0A1W2A9I5_9FIRM|nr:RNA-binding S4 domain-containing protein [Papillibacter cinnamivorans]SMC57385.1 ribosome-associated protein [Papillibacter cinnamivorans DSM 12816]